WLIACLPGVRLDFGKWFGYQKTSGSDGRALHVTVLNALSAIAWPSTCRGAVPVAVIGPAAGVALMGSSALGRLPPWRETTPVVGGDQGVLINGVLPRA